MPDNKYTTTKGRYFKVIVKWQDYLSKETFIMGGLGRAAAIKKPHNISNGLVDLGIQCIIKNSGLEGNLHGFATRCRPTAIYSDGMR